MTDPNEQVPPVCVDCGRHLRHPASIRQGRGPDCQAKHELNAAEVELARRARVAS